MTEVWTKWEGEAINGAFPLRRFLSGSDHSGVFLSEYRARSLPNAAIKIVPADPARAGARLSHWRTAAGLSHPHLIRLFEGGHCQLGGQQFLFVVMEYAEQTLAQVLRTRALTPEEVQEMLLPTLDALAFLHRMNLVHGQLKPSNFLVVDDQLKLASDTIGPAGEDGRMSAAEDIRALGITMVEALTRRPPGGPDERSDSASLPATLPPAFMDVVRRCLSVDPAHRPTATDLKAQFKRAPPAAAVSVAPRVVPAAPGRAVPAQKSADRRLLVPSVAAALVILVAVWGVFRLVHGGLNSRQSASADSQSSAQPAAAAPASVSQSPKVSLPAPAEVSTASPPVVHEQIPDVSRVARGTIRGHIKVAVRVTVDSSGNVIAETLENPGPSKYFARSATAAAKQWKFAPADSQHSREWLLWFDFSRGGTTGYASARRS
jgi:TonB family protein